MATKYFDWYDGARGVQFEDGMQGRDAITPQGIERTIQTPSGSTAKSLIPLAQYPDVRSLPLMGGAVFPVSTPVAPGKLPAEPVSPAGGAIAGAVEFPSTPLGSEFVPTLPSGAIAPAMPAPADPSGLFTPSSTATTAAPRRRDGKPKIDGSGLPRIFNPLAFDPRASTSPISESEAGAAQLYDFLKKKGKTGFGIKNKTGGTTTISGKNASELATNWVSTMKNFRISGDDVGIGQMQDVADFLYGR